MMPMASPGTFVYQSLSLILYMLGNRLVRLKNLVLLDRKNRYFDLDIPYIFSFFPVNMPLPFKF